MPPFRENLRNELDFQGLTVKELSARTGIIKGTLDNYLGVRASIPPADVALKIARALNVTVEYLVTGSEDERLSSANRKSSANKSLLKDYDRLTDESKKAMSFVIHTLALAEEKNRKET